MTAPAGSEDAGLVLSAEERRMLLRAWPWPQEAATTRNGFSVLAGEVARLMEAARAEERERIAAAIEADAARLGADAIQVSRAARIARTPQPAGDAQGSQEASNGPVGDGDAGDGRGHGRDDESGRGAAL